MTSKDKTSARAAKRAARSEEASEGFWFGLFDVIIFLFPKLGLIPLALLGITTLLAKGRARNK